VVAGLKTSSTDCSLALEIVRWIAYMVRRFLMSREIRVARVPMQLARGKLPNQTTLFVEAGDEIPDDVFVSQEMLRLRMVDFVVVDDEGEPKSAPSVTKKPTAKKTSARRTS
jgi:hypothetical protein